MNTKKPIYAVGNTILLRDNWLTDKGRKATILENRGEGWYVVHVDEAHEHSFCADGNDLYVHCSMFLPWTEKED